MRSNWKFERLRNLIELKYGFGLPERKRVFGKVPVYGSSGIIGYHNELAVRGPSIIVGRKGNVGAVTFSKSVFWPIDTTYYIVENKDRYDLKFLFFLLKTLNLGRLDTAAAVPGLSRESFYNIEAKFPPLPIQHKIALILSTYDDLIELNERRIEILEEMARFIYKEWFVKFKFPGHEKVKFVDSELGNIPERWEVKFPEIANFQEGPGIRNWQYRDSGIPFLNIRCFKGGEIDLTSANYLDPEEVKKHYSHFLLNDGDFIVSSSGTLGRIAKVRKFNLPLMLNTSIIRISPREGFKGYCFLKYFLKSDYYQHQVVKFATGSAQLNYGPSHLKQFLAIKPLENIVEKFEEIIYLMELMIDKNVYANQILRQTRDMLLPKLISGEIDVYDLDIKLVGKQL